MVTHRPVDKVEQPAQIPVSPGTAAARALQDSRWYDDSTVTLGTAVATSLPERESDREAEFETLLILPPR